MKINNDVIDFTNKIIAKSNTKEELVKNLMTYENYLMLTEICSDDILYFIESIKEKAAKIIELKEFLQTFDAKCIITEDDVPHKEKTIKSKTLKKHYRHYVSDRSSGCGASDTSSSGCGVSSSSCGNSGYVYRGC